MMLFSGLFYSQGRHPGNRRLFGCLPKDSRCGDQFKR